MRLYSQCDNSNEYGSCGGILDYSDTFGGYDGGQAEYLRVPYANVGPIKVPEELSNEQVLFLTDVLPTSYWGVYNAGVKKGEYDPTDIITHKLSLSQGKHAY